MRALAAGRSFLRERGNCVRIEDEIWMCGDASELQPVVVAIGPRHARHCALSAEMILAALALKST